MIQFAEQCNATHSQLLTKYDNSLNTSELVRIIINPRDNEIDYGTDLFNAWFKMISERYTVDCSKRNEPHFMGHKGTAETHEDVVLIAVPSRIPYMCGRL